MKTAAVRTIKRGDPDTTKALGRAGVSTVHETQTRIGLMRPHMYAQLIPVQGAAARQFLRIKHRENEFKTGP